jgi:uncharacterized protein
MLRDEVYEGVKVAMKAQDKLSLDGLRYLWALIKGREIDEKKELDDKAVEAIVKSEVKKRLEALRQSQNKEWISDENKKLAAIKKFLPKQMGEDEVVKIVSEVIEGQKKDFGTVMKAVMVKTAGKADGKTVSDIVRRVLV